MNNFYVYIIFDENKIPRYIGKGSNKRVLDHWFNKKRKGKRGNKILNKKINEQYFYNFYIKNVTENVAFKIEKKLINLYGRVCNNTGTLFNFTSGGEGVSGYVYTDEDIKKRYKNRKEFKLFDQKNQAYTRLYISYGDAARELNTSISLIYSLIKNKTKVLLKRYTITPEYPSKYNDRKIMVELYDKKQNKILKYSSHKEAANDLNIDSSSITNLLNCKQSHIAYRFVLIENKDKEIIKTAGILNKNKKQPKLCKSCIIYDNFIKKTLFFSSRKECSETLKLHSGDICSLINGKLKSLKAGRYILPS